MGTWVIRLGWGTEKSDEGDCWGEAWHRGISLKSMRRAQLRLLAIVGK